MKQRAGVQRDVTGRLVYLVRQPTRDVQQLLQRGDQRAVRQLDRLGAT